LPDVGVALGFVVTGMLVLWMEGWYIDDIDNKDSECINDDGTLKIVDVLNWMNHPRPSLSSSRTNVVTA
jgi:hypothetical protein